MGLLKSISDQITQNGDLPFVEFMQQALYDPKFGYYSANLPKLGAVGDFITAPELTPLFAQTLSRQLQQALIELENPILFEFGAGSGRLCVDILQALEQLACLPDAYHILEISGNFRHRQAALVQQEIPHLFARVKWLDRWPKQPFTGLVIANEVLDAMPVHRFLQTQEQILESFITLNAKNQLCETFKPSTTPRLIAKVRELNLEDQTPYQSEINLFTEYWINQCYTMLSKGAVFLIDYGFPRHEYYHPDRKTGTLMCHYRHHVHCDPLIYLGKQDITAHVDFTQVAEAAYQAGFQIAGYTNQASFLLANGLLNLLESVEVSERFKAQQAVKQLVQSSEMGELFKVMALTKQLDIPFSGFQFYDKRASL